MPGNAYGPQIAIAAGVDWRRFRSVALFARGGTTVTGPASLGLFEDLVEATCGFTSQAGRSLTEDLQAGWDASGAPPTTITAGVDEADRPWVHSTAEAFTLTVTSSAWGWPVGTTASVVTAGSSSYPAGNVVVGTSDWTRGTWRAGPTLHLIVIDPPAVPAYSVPAADQQWTDLPVLLRASTIGDVDALQVAACLEYFDNLACDPAAGPPPAAQNRRIRWGVSSSGRVFTSRPNGVAAAITASSWDPAFAAALGFKGTETESAVNGLRVLEAANEPEGFVLPSGLKRCRPWYREHTETLDRTDGLVASNPVSHWAGWEVEVYAVGPAFQDEDLTRHLIDRFWPHVPKGRALNLYRHWGDHRRALPRRSVSRTQLAYTLLYTSERDGARGRLRCLRDSTDEELRMADYEGAPLELRQSVKVVLRARTD